MAEVVGLAGVVLAAALAYVLGQAADRTRQIREERIRASVEFTRHLMDYAAWQVRRTSLAAAGDAEDEAVMTRLRSARIEVWSAYFRVVLVADSPVVEGVARSALELAATINDQPTREGAIATGRAVREAAEHFVRTVADMLDVNAGGLALGRAIETDLDEE